MSELTSLQPRPKVLLVDDDERNLLALSEVLAPIAEVVCASSGRDALRALLRDEFAVILLDVFMPDLDGYETAALIRQREQTARIPIIFVSAVNKETEHLMRGYEMGAVDYVFKPVDALVLKSKVSVFVDLFAMRRQLEDSEKRQASILQALPMAIYEITENDGQRLQHFRGGDLDHFLGEEASGVLRGDKRWQDYVHPDDRARIDAAQEGSDAVTTEYRLIGPGGRRHHILDQRAQVKTGGGKRRWVGSLLDVTERKELEAKLVHSGKLDALGQLTGGVAHDFNNLLAAILGGVSLLERRLELSSRERTVLEHMRHAATQGTDLVRRMMSFARQQDLMPSSVVPSSLCDSVAGLVSHTLDGTVTLDWECPDDGLYLYVDRGQLELALMNLIINARDAMPEGGAIRVSIRKRELELEDKPVLVIAVGDSGTGMPADVLARVTEPFFTTKETGKGTGLGLSMVSGFARQSGGDLRIDSTEGKGTIVELILPATEIESVVTGSAGDDDLAWLSGKRLLLIDDDDAVRSILAEQFRDAGGQIDEFPSGNAALAWLKESMDDFDYVLSDFSMPGKNGIETLRGVTRLRPNARVALMTGNAEDNKLPEGHGFEIIRKPLTLQILSQAFAKAS